MRWSRYEILVGRPPYSAPVDARQTSKASSLETYRRIVAGDLVIPLHVQPHARVCQSLHATAAFLPSVHEAYTAATRVRQAISVQLAFTSLGVCEHVRFAWPRT